MGLFPYFTGKEPNGLSLKDTPATIKEKDNEPYREYGINFETGKLTGKIVEGTEAILVWVYLALKSERFKHNIYSWNYGDEIQAMIGNTYEPDLIESEAKRMVEECLLINKHITGIEDFEADFEKDQLLISFTVKTDQGDTGERRMSTYV